MNYGEGPLAAERRRLPIYDARSQLMEAISKHKTVVVVGETGSGKTTQLPQYLLEYGFARSGRGGQGGSKTAATVIACTQPRRVAAVTVARRVAQERGVSVGGLVGHRVRFDDKSSHSTRLLYMTDGALLREAVSVQERLAQEANANAEAAAISGEDTLLLPRYSVILLDEAHERTVHTDVLFAVLKGVQKRRPDLRLVVMSATLDAAAMSAYFDDAPVLYVSGRTHPVRVRYTIEPQVDYIDATLTAILQLHRSEPADGDVLVFVSGQDEIESLGTALKEAMKAAPEGTGEMIVRPLYGALSPDDQLRAFEAPPRGVRKVVLATNIAETSVTIAGIRYVIDTGVVKERTYNARSGHDKLAIRPVSKAQARQRAGRAGREAPGTCLRIYTEKAFSELADTTRPEIVRANLASVVLQILALGVTNVLNFDFMTPPPLEALEAAYALLIDLEALDADSGKLTPAGRQMADFPLDPRLGKVVLTAATKYGCGEEIVNIVALLSVESIFFSPPGAREKAERPKRKFLAPEGDQTTLLNALRAYTKVKGDKQWCYENFINIRAMKTVLETRKQIRDMCERRNLELSSAGEDTIGYRRCLLSGLFTNTAELQHDNSYRSTKTGEVCYLHPASALFAARGRKTAERPGPKGRSSVLCCEPGGGFLSQPCGRRERGGWRELRGAGARGARLARYRGAELIG